MSRLSVQKNCLLFPFLNMVTTIKKTNNAMRQPLTKNPRFVARPVVVKHQYSGPSKQGAEEYNSLKREFNSLFQGFTGNKTLIALRKVNLRIAEIKKETARVWQCKPVGLTSFAGIVARGPCKTTVETSTSPSPPPPRVPVYRHMISTFAARRDYTAAYKQQAVERQTAYELVCAMAARRPVVVHHQRDSVEFVRRRELLQAVRTARRIARYEAKPKEVSLFSPFCYASAPQAEDSIPIPSGWKNSMVDHRPWIGVARPTSIKQHKRRAVKQEPLSDQWVYFSEVPCLEISSSVKEETPIRVQRRLELTSLLSKTSLGKCLLAGILRVKALRQGKIETCQEAFEFFQSESLEDELPVPQMDPEGVVGQTITQEHQASNTVVDSIQPLERGVSHSSSRGFQEFSVSSEAQDYSTLSNRWIYAGNYSWSTNQVTNTEVMSMFLPSELIEAHQNAQNMQLFFTHRWFRGNMRIRFVLNSNAFQVGMLVASAIYGASTDDLQLWDNVYAAVQRNHARLNAGSSNDAEIVIPFKWVNSVMGFTDNSTFCKISCRVLTKLAVAAAVAPACNLAVFVTFEDIEYFGMIARDLGIIKPQMDTVATLMNVGSNLIRTLNSDANRDKPPLPLQPVSLVPQAMTSLAYMDGQPDPVNVLRADSRGQTPHCDLTDEMNPYKIMSGWGFLSTFKWPSNNTPHNSQLWTTPVVPLLEHAEYPAVGRNFVLTPLAYITSLFGYWRGDIEYRFEIVASKFHTGRLIIGSIPLFKEQKVNIDQLRYSAYRIADIADSTEIVFRAPWHWRNSFVQVRRTLTNTEIPSRLFVLVVNPLVMIDSVPPEVTVNVYVRAADNYEVAIPRAPILDPMYSDPILPPVNEYLKPYNFENKWYTSWERNLDRTDGKYVNTIYIQNVTDGWVGYTNIQEKKVYHLKRMTTKGRSFRCYILTPEGRKFVQYGVHDPALSTANAKGLIVFEKEEDAVEFVTNLSRMTAKEARSLIPETWIKDGPWSEMRIDNKWVVAPNDGDVPIWEQINVLPNSLSDLEISDNELTGQMDTSVSVPITSLDVPSLCTSKGLQVFGEATPDLKSLCRRYNHLTSIRATTATEAIPRDTPYAARVRVNPLRSVKPTMSSSYDNRYRHGVITSIGAMYRLWRGGLRYRFVVVGAPPEGTTLYVQHRYDVNIGRGSESELGPKKVTTRNDMMNTQYATFAQALSVNTTFTIEVPYYQEQEALSLLPSNLLETDTRDNGSLYLWLHNKVKGDVHIEVFYSFADDTRFSVFQGVPLTMDLNTLVPEPQGDPEPSCSYSVRDERVEANGLFSDIVDTIRAPKKVADQTVEIAADVKTTANALQKTLASLKKTTDKINGTLSNTKEQVKSKIVKTGIGCVFDVLASMKDSIFSVFTHLIYVILSPTIKTIAWALCNLYHKIFGFTMEGINIVTAFVKKIWNKCHTLYPSKHPQGDTITGQGETAEPQGDDGIVGSYAGLLFTGLATMCKVTAKPPKSFSGMADGLFAFSQAARSGSFVSRFFEDNMELFRRVWRNFVSIFGIKDQENFELLAGLRDARLKNWILESTVVCAPHNETQVISNPDWSQKVFELAVVGRAIQIVLANTQQVNPRLSSIVTENLKILKKLEKKLIDSKIYSGVRYEPWSLWVCGKAGTGKTRYLQHVATKLADDAGYTGQVAYHTITAGQKYMDGFVGQPSILLDDFMAMAPSADPESYAQYLQMASSALFNPPFAVAEEKNKLVNFSNLLISSNTEFVQNLPGISDPEAYNRRRKCLAKFEFVNPETTPDNLLRKYSDEQLQNMEHLNVFLYVAPSDPKSLCEKIERVEGETYRITVDKAIFSRASAYHAREVENYRKACVAITKKLDGLSAKGSNLAEQLIEATRELEKYTQDKFFKSTDCFKSWLGKCVEESSFLAPYLPREQEEVTEPENQGENPFEAWPLNWKELPGATNIDDYVIGPKYPIEPLSRSAVSAPQYSGGCLHENFDFEHLSWDEEYQVYSSHRRVGVTERMALSMPHGPCLYKELNRNKYELKPMPECIWISSDSNDIPKKNKIFLKIFTNPLDKAENFQLLEYARLNNDWTVFEEKYHLEVAEWIKRNFGQEKPLNNEIHQVMRQLEFAQKKMRELHEEVDGVLVPKRPLWQRIGIAIWKVLVAVLRFIPIVIACLSSLILFSTTLAWISESNTQREEKLAALSEPNLHPSGDYKTIKSARAIRTRALKMLEAEGPEMSTEAEVLKSCLSKGQDNGGLNKVIANTFFMVGKVPVSDTTFVTYKARCIGLYNKTFIVIRHYIEHFKAQGVESVFIILHGGSTMVEYKLDDFEFRWTNQGYGTSSLPASFPRNFKNILGQIPSQNFDGNYPYNCKAVEVFADDTIEHSISIRRLEAPVKIPATTTQTSWAIDQGLTYSWGGTGKCGSFIFAPSMACPLIGIHTAGCGTRKGYAELLLRETFDQCDEHVIQYVNPQMKTSPSVYGLDGFYEEVGQLEPDMVPRMSVKTKIQPSEIHGVFDVKTEPAPLLGSDARLEKVADIVKIGTSKRCNPLREFRAGAVHSAYVTLYKLYDRVLTPARSNIGPLTVTQACEGLELAGYDSMEFRTSEGHPWTKLRPAGASDKSWMFQLSNYPDGRNKVDGIVPELASALKVKHELRKRGVVPATYFTACLKDARIPLRKISTPGSTRVFEMSPVELTIAQRQYYMDFTVAYRNARLQAEHSIGINPDGPEWTELVNWLTEFSLCILTADYSGYGPRLSHALLEKAFDISNVWLSNHEECSEDEADERCLIREVLKHEVAHGLHIVKDLVFRPSCGLPSGNCETVERNSITNSLYIRIAFYELAKRYAPQYQDPYWFTQKVRLVTNGDDLIASVKEDVVSWFNNRTLIEFFAEYGLKMTDALKSGEVREYCSIEEASYLKRGFVPHPTRDGQWMAPLEEASITDTANWIWRSVNDKLASLVNSEQACRLAYTKGPKFYYYVCSKIKKAWAQQEQSFDFPPWELLDNHVWDGVEGPKFCF